MISKKILVSAALIAMSFATASAAYDEINCSSDAVFTTNSCNQCFDGGEKSTGDNMGLLSDLWVNSGNVDQLVYKEEQDMPKMVTFNGASWSQTPSSDGFWEYTAEFNDLFSETEEGYLLEAGERVTWLKSTLGYAYKLGTNPADEGDNIGLLVYALTTHDLVDGEIDADGREHRECVLFQSAEATEVIPEEEEEEEEEKILPETGPEHILLILLALILGFGIFKLRKKSQ